MADRVWKEVCAVDLYDGDTVEGFGLILDSWDDETERDYNGACMDDECCGVTSRPVVSGFRFEDGTVKLWNSSTTVKAFIDPDWLF